jgi:hypothetical protein
LRIYDEGQHYRVTVSDVDIAGFNGQCRRECRLAKAFSATFDKRNGDLIDTNCKVDRAETKALIEDAQLWGVKRLKLDPVTQGFKCNRGKCARR